VSYTSAGTNDDRSGFGVMHSCGVGRSKRAIKRPKAKTKGVAFGPIALPRGEFASGGTTASGAIKLKNSKSHAHLAMLNLSTQGAA
jgi:hypothetical protein